MQTELLSEIINKIPFNFNFLEQYIPENFHRYIEFIPLFLAAFVLSMLLTPMIGYIAKKTNIVDKPSHERNSKFNKYDNPERHIHKIPTPLLGGLAFILPVVAALIMLSGLSNDIKAILVATLVLLLVGILDDIYNLPAIIQLLGQIAAATIIAFSTINLSIINIPLDGVLNLNWFDVSFNILSYPAQIIFPGDIIMIGWILVCINAIKFVNGSDGLMEGNAIIITLLFFVLGVRTSSEIVTLMSLILAGSLTGFLVFNFPPAKIFSGSAGKTTLGFLIAVMAMLNNTKFAASIMILALPMLDFFFVIVKRYIIHKPKNLLDLIRINDTNHLHHQLITIGMSARQIVLIETSATLLIGLIAILTTGAMNFFFLIFFAFLVITGTLALHIISTLKQKNTKPKNESPESRYSY